MQEGRESGPGLHMTTLGLYLFCVCFYFTLGCLSISQAVSSHRMIKSLFHVFYKDSWWGAEKLSDLHKTPLSISALQSVMKFKSDSESSAPVCVLHNLSVIWFHQLQASLALLCRVPLVQLPWDASGFDSLVLCSDKHCELIGKYVLVNTRFHLSWMISWLFEVLMILIWLGVSE